MSQVYAIGCGDKWIKVGCALSARDRLNALQVGLPMKLELLAYRNGDQRAEHLLHARLASSWVRGEWFAPNRPDRYWLLNVLNEKLPFPDASETRLVRPKVVSLERIAEGLNLSRHEADRVVRRRGFPAPLSFRPERLWEAPLIVRWAKINERVYQ